MRERSKSELEIFSKSFQKDVKFFKNMSQKRERGKRLKSGSPGTPFETQNGQNFS